MTVITSDGLAANHCRRVTLKLCVLVSIGLFVFYRYPSGDRASRSLREAGPIASDRGRNDAVLPFEITPQVFHSDCKVRSAPDKQRGLTQRIEPVFQASYPGSGARMTRYLVEAVTELRTGFGPWTLQRNRHKVTIKTHYPNPSEIPFEHNGEILLKASEFYSRAILLIRHPLSAIPSYCSFTFEQSQGLPNHSTRATLDYWLQWRDNFFEESLQGWATHLQYWMDGFSSENRVVVSYESLTNPKTGPNDLYRLHMFLKFGSAIHPPEDIPCIWNKVVNYHKKVDLQEVLEENIMYQNNSFERLMSQVKIDHGYPPTNLNLIDKVVPEDRVRSLHPVIHLQDQDSHRRLFEDPSNPMNSLRIGRSTYPFTVEQIEKTVHMLNNMKNKYLHEPVLAPILERYIEMALNAS